MSDALLTVPQLASGTSIDTNDKFPFWDNSVSKLVYADKNLMLNYFGQSGTANMTLTDLNDVTITGSAAINDVLVNISGSPNQFKSVSPVTLAQEWGGKIVWDATDGYHLEAGCRMVNGKELYWASSITRSGLSGLASGTFHNVYLYDNAGTPAVEESSTAPAMNYNFGRPYWQKTGDASRRLMGGIYVNVANSIQHFISQLKDNDLEVYYVATDEVNFNNTEFEVVSGATGTSYTPFALVMIPETAATHWWAAAKISFPNDGDDGILALDPQDMSDLYSQAGGQGLYTVRNAIGAGTNKRTFFGRAWLPMVISQSYFYCIQNIGGSVISAYVECHGWRMTI